MPIDRSDPLIINRILLAGLGKVKARALEDGVKPEKLARDVQILKAVAVGSINQASHRCRCHRRTVEKILRKYEGYALEIIGGRQ